MNMNFMKTRIIALYLPQFHPIPENDKWWGKGFTEWTNVKNAHPLFNGHNQPRIPTELGYYDLRDPKIREKQAKMAKDAGIEGFCYYHYWFGGKQLLEQPFAEVVRTGKPDYPFCLCWANHTWSNKTWQRKSAVQKNSVLIEQTYPGYDDDVLHFMTLLHAFQDKRYIKVDGKLLFVIYDCFGFPSIKNFMKTWNELAKDNGLPGFFFVGMTPSTLTFRIDGEGVKHRVNPNLNSSAEIFNYVLSLGFDAVNSFGKRRGEMLYEGKIKSIIKRGLRLIGLNIGKKTYDYERTVKNFFPPEDTWDNVFPTVLPQWDRTPRMKSADGIYINATPEKFGKHLKDAIKIVSKKSLEHRIIFLKSWNEWGEGNYIEPDILYGHGFLEEIKKILNK